MPSAASLLPGCSRCRADQLDPNVLVSRHDASCRTPICESLPFRQGLTCRRNVSQHDVSGRHRRLHPGSCWRADAGSWQGPWRHPTSPRSRASSRRRGRRSRGRGGRAARRGGHPPQSCRRYGAARGASRERELTSRRGERDSARVATRLQEVARYEISGTSGCFVTGLVKPRRAPWDPRAPAGQG